MSETEPKAQPPRMRPRLQSASDSSHATVGHVVAKLFTWDTFWLTLLMAVILMRYPMTIVSLAGQVNYRPLYEFYTHAAVGMFAAGMLLCNIHWFKTRMTAIPAVLSGIIGLSALLHIALGGDEYAFEGIMLIGIPMIAFLKFRTLFTLLPWYIAAVWAMDVFHALHHAYLMFISPPYNAVWSPFLHDWFTQTLDVVSMAGNRNWQAAFLMATTPFACFAAWRIIRFCCEGLEARIYWSVITIGPILGISYFCYAPMDSRASMLSAFFAASVFALIFILRYFRQNRKLQMLVLGGILFGGTVALCGGAWIFKDKIAQKGHELNVTDVRIPMWHAAVDFIMETQPPSRQDFYPPQGVGLRWLTGCGSKYYEDQFVIYRQPDYFTRPSPANRTDYPHNHTLYVAGYLGVPAAVAWVLLALIPLGAAFFRLSRNAHFRGHWALPLWCVLVLLPHAQLDLVMEYWPMAAFLLLSLGLLWRLAWPAKAGSFPTWKEMNQKSLTAWQIFRVTVLLAGIFLVVWSGWFALRIGMSNIYEREATIDRDLAALPELKQYASQLYRKADKDIWDSLRWEPAMDVAYIGLVNAWSGFPRQETGPRTMEYLKHIYQVQRRFNYCNVNWFYALMTEDQGHIDQAEAGYLRQTRVYPVGFLGWISLRDFYLRHGKRAEQRFCEAQLQKVMEIKGIVVEAKHFKPGMTYSQAIALPGAKEYFLNLVQRDPTIDLKPWSNPCFAKPDSDFPTFDESRWPDMSFIHKRLKPNLGFTKVDSKDDPCLTPYLDSAK